MRLPALCFRMEPGINIIINFFSIIFCCWMMSLRPLKMSHHQMNLMKLSLRLRLHRCFLKQIRHYMMNRRCMKICCLNCLNPKNTNYRSFFSTGLNNFLSCCRKSLTCLQVNMRNCFFRCLMEPVYSSVWYWFCL